MFVASYSLRLRLHRRCAELCKKTNTPRTLKMTSQGKMLLILEKEIAMKLTSGPSPAFPATVELSTHHLTSGLRCAGFAGQN